MPTAEWFAKQFEEHRPHLRAAAYRMLGSASEAEDAVQESWIRLGRTDVSGVENWITEGKQQPAAGPARADRPRRGDATELN